MRREARPTILLVDDNPQIRSFIRTALDDGGFDCIEAMDGDEAVYYAEASRPDLIVLDIELGDPSMDGLDVCSRIRKLGLRMPVIFLTVRGTVEDLQYGLKVAGPGSDYVRKLEELRRMQVEGKHSARLRRPTANHQFCVGPKRPQSCCSRTDSENAVILGTRTSRRTR